MVTLELNKQQAAVVKALVGNVTGNPSESWRQFSSQVFFDIPHVDEDLYEQVRKDIRTSCKDPVGIQASVLKPDPFTVEQVVQSIRNAVSHYGHDWVDPNAGKGTAGSCKNNYTNEEGEELHCLAGWVYHDLTGSPVASQGSVSLVCIDGELDGRFEQEALDVLTFAQALQDRGTPWGAVLHAVLNR